MRVLENPMMQIAILVGVSLIYIILRRIFRHNWPKWLKVIYILMPLFLIDVTILAFEAPTATIWLWILFIWTGVAIGLTLWQGLTTGEFFYWRFIKQAWIFSSYYFSVIYLIVLVLHVTVLK